MSKRKFTKSEQKAHESAENSRFILIVVVATVILVALVYYLTN